LFWEEGKNMITKETRIIDVLQNYPQTMEIFHQFGMGCIGCMGVTMETLENGAKMHDIPIDDLVRELNRKVQAGL
jgi:hybrid cluster-associated redox disulfide protein